MARGEGDGLGDRPGLADHGATAEATFRAALGRRPYDIVVIGAGVRLDLALTHLLEVLVNLTHDLAPQATIVFNQRVPV